MAGKCVGEWEARPGPDVMDWSCGLTGKHPARAVSSCEAGFVLKNDKSGCIAAKKK